MADIEHSKTPPAASHIAGHDPTKSSVAAVIEWSIRNQMLVLIAALALIVGGWLSLNKTPLDAIPDLSDTQVILSVPNSRGNHGRSLKIS